nr:myb/SANT-like domain-containing protein [Tanacetum cinerariifolium]
MMVSVVVDLGIHGLGLVIVAIGKKLVVVLVGIQVPIKSIVLMIGGKKIEENDNVKIFRTKTPSKELQEVWDQIFRGSVASGGNETAPGMDVGTTSEAPIVNLENADVEFDDNADTYEVFQQYSDCFERLDAQEEGFYRGLMKDVGQDIPSSSEIGISKQANKSSNLTMKPKNVKMKCIGRGSSGSRMFKEFMVKQDRLIEILKSDAYGVNKDDPYSDSRCMNVINDTINGGIMPDDSHLFYVAMNLFEDAVKRELFMTMRTDASRLKWLQHKQARGE